jgi:transcriptional regulator with XRE-family HTH domain
MSKPKTKKHVETQQEIADAVGKSRKTISRWLRESGGITGAKQIGLVTASGRYIVKAWRTLAELRAADGDDGTGDESQSSAKVEQIILQNERLRFRIGKEKGALIPMDKAKEIFGKLLMSAKSRTYASVVRMVTLARLAPNTALAAEEVKKEVDAIWQSLTDSKWLKDQPTKQLPQQTPVTTEQS